MESRFDEFWNRKREPRPEPIDPDRAAAEALVGWFDERFDELKPATRERLYALMVLLLHRYFYYRRRALETQRDPLHRAFETCYDRLEELIEDTDMPLPRLQELTAAAQPSAKPDEDFIELY